MSHRASHFTPAWGPSCKAILWNLLAKTAVSTTEIESMAFTGECRRYPPVLNLPMILGSILEGIEEVRSNQAKDNEDFATEMDFFDMAQEVGPCAVWPTVDLPSEPWCGEYQPIPSRFSDWNKFVQSLPSGCRGPLRKLRIASWEGLMSPSLHPGHWSREGMPAFGPGSYYNLVMSIESFGIKIPDHWNPPKPIPRKPSS